MTREFRELLKRDNQLNTFASVLIVVLLAIIGFLSFVVISGIEVGELWLLRNQFAQILIPGLLLMVILYMADKHGRLRKRLQATHDDLVTASHELEDAYSRIMFAHEVATVVADLRRHDVMGSVLKQSVAYYDADVAAVVTGNDVDVFATDKEHEDAARAAAMSLSVESVRTGKPAMSENPDGTYSIAVPIRVKEMLHSVVVLWRRSRSFTEDDVDGLVLLAKVLELGTENKHLVLELRDQIKGSLGLLTTLIEDHQKEYSGHSANVANLAAAVGARMGIVGEPMEDLKLAALVHDLGMLRVPKEILDLKRPLTPEEQAQVDLHPAIGSQLAKTTGLRLEVQETILAHHERIDGSGFPRKLHAFQIPFAARIVAVCDTFDAMTRHRNGRTPLSTREALDEIGRLAGTKYDAEVVTAFLAVVTEHLEMEALSSLASVPTSTEDPPRSVNRALYA